MSALEEAENLSSQEDEAPPKFPVKDLFILASVRFAEPISFTSINPYVFFLIASFGIAKEDVGIYAGILFATFPLAEFATSLFWVRLSNKIGRRPVVLMGLAGCILPTLMFGYSKSVVEAMIWRTLSGLINGNAPVIATACAEMVTYKPYQARAFSVMPVTWSIGSVLGPLLGGSLSDPVEQYPSLFQDDTVLRRFFLKHRFSLPSTVNAVLFLITLIVAYFALKEPSAPVYLADRSIINERSHLLPRSSSSDSITSSETASVKSASLWQEARHLTPQIYLNLGLSALFCYITMSTDQIFPLLASTSRELGGLALSAPQVGYIFTVVSILCICGQMAFPYVHRLLGNRGCLKLASICCIACCIISPNMVHLAYLIDGGEPELSTTLQQSGVLGMAMLCLMQQRLAGILGFPALVMLLTNAVPRVSEASGLQDNGKRIAGRSMLGTVNGLSQTINCASRGIGPLMMGPFWAWSLRSGRQWIFWAFVASLSACVRMLLFKVDDEEEHIETRP